MIKYLQMSLVFLVVGLYLGYSWVHTERFPFDLEGIKHLPVQHEGRLKPLDAVARNALLVVHGKQSFSYEGRRISPIYWLLEVTMDSQKGANYPIFRIDHPEVLSLVHKKVEDGKYYSFQDLKSYLDEIQRQAFRANNKKEKPLDSYQDAVIKLMQQLSIYVQLANSLAPEASDDFFRELEKVDEKKVQPDSYYMTQLLEKYPLSAPAPFFNALYPQGGRDQERWLNVGEALIGGVHGKTLHPGILSYAKMIKAYRQGDGEVFNRSVLEYQKQIDARYPNISARASFEVFFNEVQPFYLSILIYIMVFIFIFLSWIIWPQSCQRLAFYLLVAGFLIHTSGLVIRMVLEERPPVTNLYSSAVFVGWGAVLLGLVLEKLFRDGMGTVVAAVIGSLSLVIAQHLAGSGDTMEVMRAVLNSNFWLATHVVTITIGYSSTFLAGFLGCFYILRRLISRSDSDKEALAMGQMVYGVICFSLLFSFIGTVLGGIWADQSWGRFWGWDPKENGALLIVLWHAIVLHARWAGLVKNLGLMVLAVFGNIVTSFSWFGVNMLGVGLHSYGFTNQAFFWLSLFVLSQLLIMALAWIPIPGKSLSRGSPQQK